MNTTNTRIRRRKEHQVNGRVVEFDRVQPHMAKRFYSVEGVGLGVEFLENESVGLL